MARPPSVNSRRRRFSLWPAIAAWAAGLCALGAFHRTRGEPAPNDYVCVCANFQVCTTRPVPVAAVDPYELPICAEGTVMNTRIKYRDWPHRWR